MTAETSYFVPTDLERVEACGTDPCAARAVLLAALALDYGIAGRPTFAVDLARPARTPAGAWTVDARAWVEAGAPGQPPARAIPGVTTGALLRAVNSSLPPTLRRP